MVRTIDRQVPYSAVRASRGKLVRAEPIAALYEQGKVHHVGEFSELEEQLFTYTPQSGNSPDGLDALVWAITELSSRSGKPYGELANGHLRQFKNSGIRTAVTG